MRSVAAINRDRTELRTTRLPRHPELPYQRFHALLNSLFKVLFTFPSRYLSSIGLAPVFSLGWSLPPYLGCNPKQPDSARTNPRPAAPGFWALRGSHPLRHAVPSRFLALGAVSTEQPVSPDHNSPPAQGRNGDFRPGHN